jgi:putative glutamine amidotransferase
VRKKITIGITDCSKYPNYEAWISAEQSVEVIKLSYHENFDLIRKCQAIVLTGGEDVHPRFYQRPEYLAYCDQKDMDERRDEFELKAFGYSQQMKIPVLGICRGLQIANVFFGGTLIPDIPSFGKFNHTKFEPGRDRYHSIRVDKNSALKKMVGVSQGEVNSAHHQSADKIGDGLVASSLSEDGVVESLERASTEGKPFLLLVQWHPERMIDQNSPFVRDVKISFLESVRATLTLSPPSPGTRSSRAKKGGGEHLN